MSMRTSLAVLAISVAALATACGHSEKARSAAASATPTSGAAATPGGGGKPACPANGLWASCSILERLDRAGLAPRRDSGDVREDPLTQPGVRVRLGNASVELFIYADSAARKADQAKLDRRKFITADQEPSLAGERTVIVSANLLALLDSRNDHQRERVSDAITAGPPQP